MQGGIPLFNLFGIQVSLHWTWFLVAFLMVQSRMGAYSSIGWNIAEYISLFAIVLMHEFGHSLACRSVGGRADFIMLWPLGGVAFVDPPQRPGAVLWSLVAGPLVNVILVPVLFVLMIASGIDGVDALRVPANNWQHFVGNLFMINAALLVFNMLPIYPLDGGQILRAVLWFFIGPIRSLTIATVIGLGGAGLIMLLALAAGDVWLVILALFAAMQSWAGFQNAKAMRAVEEPGARMEVRCPSCAVIPPIGPAWQCQCGNRFDVFAHRGRCPNCGGVFMSIPCPSCGQLSHPYGWYAPVIAPPNARPSRGAV